MPSNTRTCLLSITVVFILMETVGLGWFKAFIKSGVHQEYMISMLIVLSLFLFTFASKLKSKSVWLSIISGAVFGYVAGFSAVFIAGLFEHGLETWIEWFKHYGLFGFGNFFFGATVTGSWLIGALLFLLARLIGARINGV